MAETIRDVMTTNPVTVEASASVTDASKLMQQHDIGNVIVVENGQVQGIVTDRDVVVRGIAAGRDPSGTSVREVCSSDPTTLAPDQSVDEAIRLMRELDVRRLPVVENGRAAGIVSLGDLAVDRDPDSVLADISAADPNR